MAHRLSREHCNPMTGQRFTVDGQEFVLQGKLGDGAVGVVRKARCIGSEHKYAVKFLAPDPKYIDETVFDDVKARFRREGLRGTKLGHLSLLKIHAYVENGDGKAFDSGIPKNPFLLMDRSMGGTVEDYIRRLRPEHCGMFVLDEMRLRIAVQIAQALDYLHRRGLVHRDVKPANVFLSSRNITDYSIVAKLGDFGVMKWGDFHASLSTGTLTATMQKGLGTLKYMSPEQAIHPKNVTVKSDIFALGLTLFELFTGQILPSPHHVYELMITRATRGTTMGRWMNLGFQLTGMQVSFGEMILDMLLRQPKRRLSIEKVRGHLEWAYRIVAERREGEEREVELKEAYKRFTESVTTAIETGNTSQLHDSATGSQINHLLGTVETNSKKELPAWRDPEIREYFDTHAEVFVTSHWSDWIICFERVDGTWKVSSIKSQPNS